MATIRDLSNELTTPAANDRIVVSDTSAPAGSQDKWMALSRIPVLALSNEFTAQQQVNVNEATNYVSTDSTHNSHIVLRNLQGGDTDSVGLGIVVSNGSATSQAAWLGAVSLTGASTYAPAVVLKMRTGASSYAEALRVTSDLSSTWVNTININSNVTTDYVSSDATHTAHMTLRNQAGGDTDSVGVSMVINNAAAVAQVAYLGVVSLTGASTYAPAVVLKVRTGPTSYAEILSTDSSRNITFNRHAKANTLAVTDGVTAPTSVSGQAIIYVDSTTGDLMVRFGDGVTKTLATDS